MKYKRLEAVSVDGSIYSWDAAHEINCLACSNGFTLGANDDELYTYQSFFEREISSCGESIRRALKLEITTVDESDVIQ